MILLRSLSRAKVCLHPTKGIPNYLSSKLANPQNLLPVTSTFLDQQNRQSKALTLITEVTKSPMPALVLGTGGVLPFAAAPIYMMAIGDYSEMAHVLQIQYGACILSFLGGIRWGATVPEQSELFPSWKNLMQAIFPCLFAWGLLSLGTLQASWGLLIMLGVTCMSDVRIWSYPMWFRCLRFFLSIGAIISVNSTMCIYYFVNAMRSEKESKDDK